MIAHVVLIFKGSNVCYAPLNIPSSMSCSDDHAQSYQFQVLGQWLIRKTVFTDADEPPSLYLNETRVDFL